MKKLLSILLSLMMVVGLVPTAVFADETAGAVPADMPETTAEEPVDEVITEEAEVLEDDLSGITVAGTLTLDAPMTIGLDSGEFLGLIFVPEEDGNYAFESMNEGNADSDPIATLYEADTGTLLTYADGGGQYGNFRLVYAMTAGTRYMLLVMQGTESGFDNFEITATKLADAAGEAPFETVGEAEVFGDIYVDVSANTPVYYSFTAPMDENYGFVVSGEASVCIDLYDAAGNYLDGDSDEYGYVYIEYVMTEGETYYIGISSSASENLELWVEYSHSYIQEVVKEPTCTTEGEIINTCIYCGIEWGIELPSGHKFGADGVCENCGAAPEGCCGAYTPEDIVWSFKDGVLSFVGTGEMEDYYDSTEAPWTAFKDKITEIVVGEGIESVGSYSFSRFVNLTKVSLPESLFTIGDSALSSCTALEEIEFSRMLYNIGSFAFMHCSNLKSVTIPSGVQHVEYDAFANTGLTEIYLESSSTVIEEDAFFNVKATVYYPTDVCGEWTEDEMLDYGGDLTWVSYIPEIVMQGDCGDDVSFKIDECGRLIIYGSGSMWDFEFEGTDAPWYNSDEVITTIAIGEGITAIGENTFSCMDNALCEVSLPSTLKTIGANAFHGCFGLGIVIPSTVEHVADGAFYGCLLYMWEPDYAYGTSGDLKWEYTKSDFTLRFSGKGEMADYYEGYPAWVEAAFPINSVVIGEGAASVGACAFSWMIDKFTVTLPSTVKTVGDGAFMFDTEVVIKFTGPAPALAEDAFAYADKIKCIYPGKDTSYTKAYRSEYYGAFDISWTKFAQPDAPTITKNINLADSGKIKLTWSKVDGAKKYQVYRSTSKTGTYSLMKTTTGTTYTNTNGKPNVYYYYYVVAVDDAGVMSPRSNVIGRRVDCAQPVVTAGNDAATGKPKLTWKAVDGAKEYKVYRATKQDGSYSLMKTTTSTSYINSNAEVGKTYYYKVKAIGKNSASNSADSAVRSRMCDLPRTKVTLSNVESSGKIKVSWTKVTGAVKYEVYRATSKNGTYSLKKTTTSLSWTDTNTTAGKTYYYQVKAIHTKSGANSAKTAYKSRMADLARPTVTTGLTSGGKPKLVWKEVTGAVKYQVYRSTSKNGTYTLMKTTTAKSWTDTGAKKGTRYYYKVRAVHSNTSANSAYSTVKYLTPTK